jgi:hypothetical protein
MSRRAIEFVFGDTAARSAVGRRLSLAPSGPTYTVVGVVGDVRDHDLGTPPSPTVYLSQGVPLAG